MDTYYNEIADGYDELHEEEQLEKLEIVKSGLRELDISIGPEFRILDVGCGTGISTRFWKDTKADRTGIDIAEKLITIAQKKDIEAQYFVESAEDIPFEDDIFDLVISITAIQNFKDIESSIKEMKRVAKKTIVLSFLKKSEKEDEIRNIINKNLEIIKEAKQDKDIILFCSK